MVGTAQERSSRMDDPSHPVVQFPGDDLLAQIQIPSQGEDPVAARRLEAEELVSMAGGRRKLLERLRSRFLRRLHRTSDDFAATEGLRVVEAALSLMPRPEGLWIGQLRKPRRRSTRT